MQKNSVMALALAAAFATPMLAVAADDQQLAEIREQISQMKASYEARLQALEQRLQQAQANATPAAVAAAAFASACAPDRVACAPDRVVTVPDQAADAALQAAPIAQPIPAPILAPILAPVLADAPQAGAGASNIFNPNMALILGGTLSRLSQDPKQYRLQGFVPSGGDAGPGRRGFDLGESELTLSANIDPQFAGQLTFSVTGDNTVSVEEAFFQTRALSNGLNLKAGRFLSSIGYLNSQHAHAWDFVDAPLAYQAFLGGQYKPDGVQAKWLAPLDQFLELGVEAGSGRNFPGNDRNSNGVGATLVFAHLGDDIGNSASWRAGLSYLRTGADARSYDDALAAGQAVRTAFTGKSATWIADAIYKWSPNGNPTATNFKLQGEYFRRTEDGSLSAAGPGPGSGSGSGPASGSYASIQSGWYLQGVYQFMPLWRGGLRYDRLASGSGDIGLVGSGALPAASFPLLEAYTPSRTTLMADYSPSEFSRLRLQLGRDKSRPGVIDNQIFLQYIMSLGTHAAHSF